MHFRSLLISCTCSILTYTTCYNQVLLNTHRLSLTFSFLLYIYTYICTIYTDTFYLMYFRSFCSILTYTNCYNQVLLTTDRLSLYNLTAALYRHILHKAKVRWYRLSPSVVRRTELEQVMYVSVQHISKGPKMH